MAWNRKFIIGKLICQAFPKSFVGANRRNIYAVCKEKVLNDECMLKKLPYDDAMKEKVIEIQTCGRLFEKWRNEKRYWKIPKGDIRFMVRYIDTGLQDYDPNESPVVLALHGSPGSYTDFDVIINHLYQHDVRIVSPLFPVGADLNPTVFRHTPEEKSEYVKDFLQAIRIPKVDMVLCHSSALFPGQLFCSQDEGITPKSLCLLNPTSFQLPRMMKPFELHKFLIRLYEFPIGYNITKFAAAQLEKKTGLTKGTSGDNFFSAFTMVHSSIPKQAVHFQKLLKKNLPIMMVYSENDKLIHRDDSHKMARMMVDDGEIQRYNAEGKLTNSGAINPFRKVLSFENGTHFVFKKHPELISKEVKKFLFEHFDNH